MIRLRSMVFLLFVGCSVGGAQTPQLDQCMAKANTQMAMNLCAEYEAIRSDDELAGQYNRLLVTADSVPGAVEKIIAVQEAWRSYRDAYINAMYPAEDKQATYGSVFQMETLLLRADLTRRQILAVRELVKRYESSAK